MDDWEPDFHEEQRFDQPWFYVLAGWIAVRELSRLVARLRSTDGARIRHWVRWAVRGVLIPASILRARLITEAGSGHLRIRLLSPIKLEWEHTTADEDGELEADVVDYRPLLDYGGRGLRWSPFKGAALTVSGRRGVKVRTPKGRSVLIGSQRPEELASSLTG